MVWLWCSLGLLRLTSPHGDSFTIGTHIVTNHYHWGPTIVGFVVIWSDRVPMFDVKSGACKGWLSPKGQRYIYLSKDLSPPSLSLSPSLSPLLPFPPSQAPNPAFLLPHTSESPFWNSPHSPWLKVLVISLVPALRKVPHLSFFVSLSPPCSFLVGW